MPRSLSTRPLRARFLQRLWLFLPLLAIPALWTYFSAGVPVTSDGAIHVMRVALLDYAVRHGSFHPRWLPQAASGLGDPALGYYWLTGYYLSEVVHLLTGLGYAASMAGAVTLLVVLAGGGAFLLARDLFGDQRPWAALVAGVAYMYTPFLLTNAMIRGALGEIGAQALLPWILWSLRRSLLSSRPAPYVLATALSLGGLAVTHNTSLLLAPPLLLAYLVVLWRQSRALLVHLRWPLLGLFAAMGISAFLWLPGLGDRVFLTARAYQNSRITLPASAWQWNNWLDTNLRFEYTFAVPFQLGLVQLGLALAGLILARRRDPEWLFLFIATICYSLAIGAWTLPVWLSSDALTMVQFPWRMLTIVSLPLALFAGGCILPLRRPATQAGVALVLLALIMYANAPRLQQVELLDKAYGQVGLPQVAHWEATTGLIGLTPLHEFAPRWAASDVYTPTLDVQAAGIGVTLLRAGANSLQAAVTSPAGGELRFATLYFPGWQARLDGRTQLAAYPSTNLGLLTMQVPAGAHQLDIAWVGTPLQRWATVLSLLSLAGLAGHCWRWSGRPWLAVIPVALLLVGAAANYWPAQEDSVRMPAGRIETPGVALLGYRVEQERPDAVYVYPYWDVTSTPGAAFRARWLLRNAAGAVVSDLTSRPYFGSSAANNWPAGTVVDDAYDLPLPAGLPAGSYHLFAAVEPDGMEAAVEPQAVGNVEIQDVPPAVAPSHELEYRMSDAVRLAGYDLQINRQPIGDYQQRPPVVHAGDVLEYTLYWQALRPLGLNYESYLHFVSSSGQDLIKEDQWIGEALDRSTTWDAIRLQPDRYRLIVPGRASAGLYVPYVGIYTQYPISLLPVSDGQGRPVTGDQVPLQPVKVLDRQSDMPANAVSARLGDFASLLGYDLKTAGAIVAPGGRLALTLYYQASSTTPANYTRFVHLYRAGVGMAAQSDAVPQNGDNPTFAWEPGEIIRDEVVLPVAPDAQPGDYSLQVGFYDPQAGGARLSLRDGRGRPLPDDQISLATLAVR